MKLKKFSLSLVLISIFAFSYAYYIDENGKKVTVNRNQANIIDDIEIKEGEALSQKQIINIVNDSGSGIEEL
ncbi:membrane protein [Candidatus Francisella endociliophora]|uniref:Membrane protein n=1 Tax=Candidatus Francisella endociliophora TaxID=653937 RepID=A0A097EM21_9GAMM|nr:hypothetical protein [Francisella sp. FSC1006]AIT08616.1 membrane protein [Francisella sp. FSC1006]